MTALLAFFATYYALTLLWYWAPLLAMLCGKTPSPLVGEGWDGGECRKVVPSPKPSPTPPLRIGGSAKAGVAERGEGSRPPFLVIVSPCRGGAGSIRGMVEFLKNQDYPHDRYRIVLAIDTDETSDPSPDIARAAGAEVYERHRPAVKTKGHAINELLDRRLKHEPWDALMVLDIDTRAEPDYLTRVAAYLNRGAQVIQCAVLSKNPDDNPITRISHSGQLLSQLIQRGRSRFGLSAILSGGGMVFTRATLERLDWQTSTGRRLSDDGELNVRLILNDIPATYGESLGLRNDLPTDIQSVRLQRQRWFAAQPEAFSYIAPLLRKALTGHWRALEGIFSFVFLPGSSLSFILGGLAAFFLDGFGVMHPRFRWWGGIATALWLLHVLYYVLALRTVNRGFNRQELKRLPGFLAVRVIAILQGAVLGSRANPGHYSIPSDHTE